VYDWGVLDAWLDLAESHGVDVTYVFGGTPGWASSSPNAPCEYHAGACYPPAQMQDWDEFVFAIATHAAGRIKYWELWNEPNLPHFWSGSIPAMAHMAQRAYRIIKSVDPAAVILTPSPTAGATGISAWFDRYFALGGGAYADIVAFHSYPPFDRSATAEYINKVVDAVEQVTSAHGQDSKPIWDTEASWGRITRLPDMDAQAAFVARSYILHWSRGVQRFYWYNWNSLLWGTLWDSFTSTVLKPGIAYGEVYKWLVGATLSTPCAMTTGSIWTCTLTRPGGYEAEIVWNSAVTSADTLPYTPGSHFAQYRDLDGNVVGITGATAPIGSKPILLEPFTALALSPGILQFPLTPVGAVSGSRAVALTNAGNAPLLISAVETTGDYHQANHCGGSVAIGSTCEIEVTFAPTMAGLRTGALLIHDNAPGSPHTVLLANGTPAAPVILSPSNLDFSGQVVGAAAVSKKATLTNASDQVLTISGVAIENTTGDHFFVSDNTCARTLAPGTGCSITVTFAPKTVGRHAASLGVVDGLSAHPRIVSLTGQGWDFVLNMKNDVPPVSRLSENTATYALDVAPQGGFRGLVALSVNCYNIPEVKSCVAVPESLQMDGSSPAAVTVSVGTTRMMPLSAQFIAVAGFFLLAGWKAVVKPRARYLGIAAVFLLLAFLAACAGVPRGGSDSTPERSPAIVVTGSSRGVTRTLHLPVPSL
jgi:hypothetical protein